MRERGREREREFNIQNHSESKHPLCPAGEKEDRDGHVIAARLKAGACRDEEIWIVYQGMMSDF